MMHWRPATMREHPRVRGENTNFFQFFRPKYGTSPRARGKQIRTRGDSHIRGNIPACAGKTKFGSKSTHQTGEHPRVRGENYRPLWGGRGRGGTSPRARGKLTVWQLRRISPRNIPACAGKTLCFEQVRGEAQEHPRVRGENTSFGLPTPNLVGTSPRARGKPVLIYESY